VTSIAFIADTHGAHWDIDVPKADILIHAGDCLGHGNITEVKDLNTWFGTLPHKFKICVAGNHDWAFQESLEACRKILTNCIYLHDSSAEVLGLKVYGSPYSPRFFDWAFNLDEHELAPKWALIPDDTDILVTHGPPFGILDRTREGRDVGCAHLLARVQQVKPRIHAFGHIHEGYGMKKKHGTTFVNASVMTRDYDPLNRAIVCKLKEKKS
jgi:Icc-related predicted phosphoesterase